MKSNVDNGGTALQELLEVVPLLFTTCGVTAKKEELETMKLLVELLDAMTKFGAAKDDPVAIMDGKQQQQRKQQQQDTLATLMRATQRAAKLLGSVQWHGDVFKVRVKEAQAEVNTETSKAMASSKATLQQAVNELKLHAGGGATAGARWDELLVENASWEALLDVAKQQGFLDKNIRELRASIAATSEVQPC